MHNVFIGVGSNVDPERNLLAAFSSMVELLDAVCVSTVYQSPAIGMRGNDFLNTVVSARTGLTPVSLVNELHAIEEQLGRDRSEGSFSNRTIDLDLLLYNNLVIREDAFCLPRPEIYTDAFVLQPLVDLDADSVDPLSGRPMAELLRELKRDFPERFCAMQAITPLRFRAIDRHRQQVSHP